MANRDRAAADVSPEFVDRMRDFQPDITDATPEEARLAGLLASGMGVDEAMDVIHADGEG